MSNGPLPNEPWTDYVGRMDHEAYLRSLKNITPSAKQSGSSIKKKVGRIIGYTAVSVAGMATFIASLPQPKNLAEADGQYVLDAKNCKSFLGQIGVMIHSGPRRCSQIARDHTKTPTP